MSHSHDHISAAGRHRWRLAVSFVLVAAFFVVELIAGLLSGSLALISDAGHMAADVTTLGAALVATRLATRKDTSGRRTFGSYRAEVFAAALAVLVMLGVGVYIGIEAIGRIGTIAEPASGAMILVGVLGLVVNLISLFLLRAGATQSMNLKGAYLEVVADTAGSVGVISAGALVGATGHAWWDTVVAVAIAVFVIVRAVMLGREVLAVLGQHAPRGIEPAAIEAALSRIAGTTAVHDLHVWQLTSGMDVATAHLVIAPGVEPSAVLGAATTTLREEFAIAHATIQVESDTGSSCPGADW